MTEEHKKHDSEYHKLSLSIIIISDSRYKHLENNKENNDLTTPLIKKLLLEQNHEICSTDLIPNESSLIKKKMETVIEKFHPDIIITSGGTGIGKRDITIETMSELFSKELTGFGELFRSLSYKKIGITAILSRATAGIYRNTLVFNLPGSPKAVELAISEIILPMVPHAISMLHG